LLDPHLHGLIPDHPNNFYALPADLLIGISDGIQAERATTRQPLGIYHRNPDFALPDGLLDDD
jgi:hypothetical protein